MKELLLYGQCLLYVLAGINHFWHPVPYLRIMPSWIPAHNAMVMVSGIAEIVCGLLLFFPATRVIGAWMIILLLLAVFPANIQMLINYLRIHSRFTWIAWLRIPIQALLIYWAYRYTRTPAGV